MHLSYKIVKPSRILSKTHCLFSILFAIAAPLFAQMEQSSPTSVPKEVLTATNAPTRLSPMEDTGDAVSKIFVEDRITLEFMAGALFSPCGLGPTAPVFNYQQNNIRLGWMLDSPNSWGPCADIDSPLRGNFEGIFENHRLLYLAQLWNLHGRNHRTRPATTSFSQTGSWFPTFRAGLVSSTRTPETGRTRMPLGAIGSSTPQFSGGLKFLIDDNFSFNIEGSLPAHLERQHLCPQRRGERLRWLCRLHLLLRRSLAPRRQALIPG